MSNFGGLSRLPKNNLEVLRKIAKTGNNNKNTSNAYMLNMVNGAEFYISSYDEDTLTVFPNPNNTSYMNKIFMDDYLIEKNDNSLVISVNVVYNQSFVFYYYGFNKTMLEMFEESELANNLDYG